MGSHRHLCMCTSLRLLEPPPLIFAWLCCRVQVGLGMMVKEGPESGKSPAAAGEQQQEAAAASGGAGGAEPAAAEPEPMQQDGAQPPAAAEPEPERSEEEWEMLNK